MGRKISGWNLDSTVSNFSEVQWHWFWWVEPFKRCLQLLPDSCMLGWLCRRKRGKGAAMAWGAHKYILYQKTLKSNMARPTERKYPVQHSGTTAQGVFASAAINRGLQTWQWNEKYFFNPHKEKNRSNMFSTQWIHFPGFLKGIAAFFFFFGTPAI